MEQNTIKELEKKYIMQSYGRFDLAIDRGEGAYVFDKKGKKYLDFICGIACVPVGHANEYVTNAIIEQAKKLVQVSNLYYTEPQVELAERLVKLSGLKKCFFCNSGAEANEAAIKLAKKVTGKKEFIVAENAFHGRTHASLAATWKGSYKEKFHPLVEGFKFVPYNNVKAIEKAITKDTAAVMLEPIQGEAGIIVPDEDYLKKVQEICENKKVLLIIDEVQSGNGRTGKFFAYKHSGIKPDIVTLAKGLANGVPIGVCISEYEFEKGDHASTFGGNNLSCAAANATIDYILKNKLMDNAVEVGEYFMDKLKKLPKVKKVKGKGLMIGADVEGDAKQIVEECLKKGFLINNATEHTLRFLPPLMIDKKEIDIAIKILEEALADA
ncbi:MAG: aspartate aminotransferase family protein [Nanoarchaeota archaeon]|nr:aspartate aminotransferase family protein [Nanoarchaeota archaeon]